MINNTYSRKFCEFFNEEEGTIPTPPNLPNEPKQNPNTPKINTTTGDNPYKGTKPTPPPPSSSKK